jgi:hypothetical protein
MKSALKKLAIAIGLLGPLALSAANPTLARTSRPATSTDKVLHSYTCDDYWLARGYYPHYYGGSSACYACRSSY